MLCFLIMKWMSLTSFLLEMPWVPSLVTMVTSLCCIMMSLYTGMHGMWWITTSKPGNYGKPLSPESLLHVYRKHYFPLWYEKDYHEGINIHVHVCKHFAWHDSLLFHYNEYWHWLKKKIHGYPLKTWPNHLLIFCDINHNLF